MGFRSEGVFIKCNYKDVEIDKIAYEIFGPVVRVSTDEYQKSDLDNGDVTTIDIHKEGVNLINYRYTSKFLNETDYKEIHKLKSLLSNYECILAYAIYDSADSYGFRYIANNRPTDRMKYLHHNGIQYESGDPLDDELKYLNGRHFRDKEHENHIVIETNNDGKIDTHTYYDMFSLTYEMIQNKLGMSIDLYTQGLIESVSFKRIEI